MIERPIATLIPQEKLQEEVIILDRLSRGERIDHFETVRLHTDCSPIDVSITISPIRDENGKIIGASKIVRDISERKATQRQIERLLSELARAARVSDMGQIASALAHELKQPSTAIMNYLNAAELGLEGDEHQATREMVQKASMQANRASEIIIRMRDFIRKKPTPHTEENVNNLIEETPAHPRPAARARSPLQT